MSSSSSSMRMPVWRRTSTTAKPQKASSSSTTAPRRWPLAAPRSEISRRLGVARMFAYNFVCRRATPTSVVRFEP
ncbi:MAG: hypothetical protein LC808_01435 [Actinobacteria bacterium]|nr:hypothetical protein [Actinomycetota bacterium]